MTLPTNINQVITQLEQIIQDAEMQGKREGYFAALYLRVTKAVKQKIDEGYFDDNPRMEQLDVTFANRYITAYYQYKNQETCTASWLLTFDLCRHWQPLVLQHLLTGMNAHIGLDLGIAAATVCSDSAIGSLHNDFNKINDILGSLVNTVEQEIEEMWPILKPILWLGGKLDEEIVNFSMAIARNAAWQTAVDYAPLVSSQDKANFISNRDSKVASFGKKIASPGIRLSLVISILRIFERGSVKRKVEILNEKNKKF